MSEVANSSEHKKYKIGYTTGVFDLFHIGHLNILKRAKDYCDYLIVGVTTDELALYKNANIYIPFNERFEIVSSIRYVDKVVPQKNMDKIEAFKELNFDVIFVGDDWKGTVKWIKIENELKLEGVDVVYFPYTKTISSTKLRLILEKSLTDLNE